MLSFGGVETYEKEVVEIVEPPTVEEMIAEYPWNIEEVHKIISCESSWNPNAVGDTDTPYHSYGLFQIRALPSRPDPEWLLIEKNNIEYAYKLWSQTKSFTRHWVNCSKRL